MRTLVLGTLTALLAPLALPVQSADLYTRPQLPRADELARLGLKTRWHAYIPMAGRNDRITFAQVFDHQVAVETDSGAFAALNGETGMIQYRVQLGSPREHKEPVAANDLTFFVMSGAQLFAIDRATGMTEWRFKLPGALSAPPAADDRRLYVCTADNKMTAYVLPTSLAETRAGPSAAKPTEVPKATDPVDRSRGLRLPERLWAFQSDTALQQPPAIFEHHIIFTNMAGQVFCFQKDQRFLADQAEAAAAISAQLTAVGNSAYVASQDYNVYAFDLVSGKLQLRWRYTTGSRILQKPIAVGDDLFVIAANHGMFALDRFTGLPRWSTPQGKAIEFIGATPRMVFARDKRGFLLALDRQKGKVLGTLDTHDFAVLPANDASDRIYLLNHDGLVLCLQDVEQSQPVYHQREFRKAFEKPAPPKDADKPADEKPADKKPDKDKKDDEMKDMDKPKKDKDAKAPAKNNPEKKDPEKKDPEKKDP